MYPTVHAVTGTLCTLGVYAITKDTVVSAIIGGALAFGSHDVMDRFGEKHYPTTKFLLIFEGILFSIFYFLAWKSNLTILYVVGGFNGILMDLIDKRMGLSIYNPTKYPYMQWFNCHKRKPNFDLTLKQTKLAAYLATIVLILITFLQ